MNLVISKINSSQWYEIIEKLFKWVESNAIIECLRILNNAIDEKIHKVI